MILQFLCAQEQPVDVAGSAALCPGVDEPLHPRPPAPGQRLRKYSHAPQPAGHQVRQRDRRMGVEREKGRYFSACIGWGGVRTVCYCTVRTIPLLPSGLSWDGVMYEGTIKTPNPKCCLYWYLIEFID